MRPDSRTKARRPRCGTSSAFLFVVTLLCALSSAAFASATAREDLAGWDQTSWGMKAPALDKLYAPALVTVDPPIDYGSNLASRALRNLDFAGFGWRVLFQFDREKQGLAQVMLERNRLGFAPKAYDAALAELEARYGPPDLVCDSPHGGVGSSAKHQESVWRLATTSIHLVFLDIGSGELQYDVFQWPPDPQNQAWPPRFHGRGSYPQRLLIRFHPTARTDLFMPGCGR